MKKLMLSVLGAIALTSMPAYSGLIGDQFQWDYYAYGGLYEAGNTWTVAGSGGNFCIACGVTYFSITADDTSITFDYSVNNGPSPWSSSSLSLAPTISNGIAINLVSGSPFTSVSIDPATNMAGFNASRFSFTGSQIQVDWADLAFSRDTIVKLDVNSNSVPEPGSMLGLSVAVLVLWRARKNRSRLSHD